MKKVTIRVDVDVHNSSLIKNKLKINSGCKYLTRVLKICEEHGIKLVFMFRPIYAMPAAEIIDAVIKQGNEIALHADNISVAELIRERKLLETRSNVKIEGLAYHGGDFIDNILFKIFKKEKYRGNLGTPFQALLAGFKYDATGYLNTPSNPTLLSMGKKSIIVFQGHATIDWISPRKIESLFRNDYTILMFHPNYLGGYSFRKPTIYLIEKIFDYVRKSNFEQLTFTEWIKHYGSALHPAGHSLPF